MLKTNESIKKVFHNFGFTDVKKIRKIDVGFCNDVYSIDEKYILKVNKDIADERDLEKEVFFCNLFKNKIPAPEVLVFDTSKKLLPNYFIIYRQIQGDNLYNKWHLLTDPQRRHVIKQICGFLKKINNTSADSYIKKFKVDAAVSWEGYIYKKINNWLDKFEKNKKLSYETIKKVKNFCQVDRGILAESKMALTYFDAHFDNFIVQGDTVVGMLDFERTDWLSIDYSLELVDRMVKEPKKYSSEKTEKYIKDKDYKDLLSMYQKYYPKLFAFKNFHKRLAIYNVEHYLSDIFYFPKVKSLREGLNKVLIKV